jgi:hypothetical protein
VEASDDRENISNLSAVGAGAGVAPGGAAAGFLLPVLRYVVGGGDNTANASTADSFESLSPRDGVCQRGIFGIQKVTLFFNEGLSTMPVENGWWSV